MRRKDSPIPAKPYPDFPLFYHHCGQWAKKIKGKIRYFGIDAKEAVKLYLQERDQLLAGVDPKRDSATVGNAVNWFLAAKESQVRAGDITQRSWRDYSLTGDRIIKQLGRQTFCDDLTPAHFDILRDHFAAGSGPVTLGGHVRRTRIIFKWAVDNEYLERPVRMGTGFKVPAKRLLRAARQAASSKMFEAAEVRSMLEHASPTIRAMILLGINCGFGNTDVAGLPLSAVDLKAGWVNWPRPKTAVERRCPLWSETVKALKEAKRPRPALDGDANLVFLTRAGHRWVRTKDGGDGKPGLPLDALSQAFRKLLTACGIDRPGVGFYALRHTFRTIADSSRDFPAINRIMGHADNSIADLYRERIDDYRLSAVVEIVRKWLFPAKPKKKKSKKSAD
jgi:integrase